MAGPMKEPATPTSVRGSNTVPRPHTALVVGPRQVPSLLSQPRRRGKRPRRVFLATLAVFRAFPIFTFRCSCGGVTPSPTWMSEAGKSGLPATRITGTLFGYRKGKVSLSLQDSPKCVPNLVVDLGVQTHHLFRELGSGMVRIALECEKPPKAPKKKRVATALVDEPLWTVYCNGKRSGCGVRRDATEEDLAVMEVLHAVSTGAGVLPGKSNVDGPDGELAYMRAGFDHIVGSKDSETLYLVSPDGGSNGPDLTIFFVRV